MHQTALEPCLFCLEEFGHCRCGFAKAVHGIAHKACSLDAEKQKRSGQEVLIRPFLRVCCATCGGSRCQCHNL